MLSNVFALLSACALVTANDGFVVFPITRVSAPVKDTKLVIKNATVNEITPKSLLNDVFEYHTFINLGDNNPVQQVKVDTASSDLWVYGDQSGATYTFNPSNSQFVDNGFSIRYADGSQALGNYYKDKISWQSTTLVDFQFAVVQSYSSGLKRGIFGIGKVSDESSRYGPYPNFPVALKNSGKIQSAAYSLYLDNLDSNFGSLVLGAVDTSRYTGTLKLLPVTSSTKFAVDFGVSNRKLNGLLDAGASLTYLPDDVVAQIASSFGATYDVDMKAYKAPATIPDEGLTFTFGGIPITVPDSELWLERVLNSNEYYLSILPSSQAEYLVILGDSFLRSAYVVYDLSSNQVAIAQANWNPGPSNYEAITSSGIPGAQ